jgi:hypothetical protein
MTGDYGYEPNSVIHDMTNFPEEPSCTSRISGRSGTSTTKTTRSGSSTGKAS